MRYGEEIEESLKGWLDKNIPLFLRRINEEVGSDSPWEMPAVDDYVLVVAVRDYKDGLGGIFTIGERDVSAYRIRGLLTEALNS